MMTKSQLGPAEVTLDGPFYEDDANPMRMAKLTFLGMSPDLTVKLWEFLPAVKPTVVDGRVVDQGKPEGFVEYDKIVHASLTEDTNKGVTVLSGFSELHKTTMPNLTEEECRVTWSVKVTGCGDCS